MCEFFGLPPDREDRRGQRPNKTTNEPRGVVRGKDTERAYTCGSCNRSNVVKPNIAIVQEYSRISSVYRRTKRECCPNEDCEQHKTSVRLMPSAYRKFGKTAKGDPRFQCKSCKKTFSLGHATRRHFRSDLNGKVFRALMNGLTLSSAARVLDVSMVEIYRKIDFIHQQCLEFSADREKDLPKCFEGRTPHFATDTQNLTVNYPNRGVRVLVDVRHMCMVEKDSKFVIASTTDVDPSVSPFDIEQRMREVGDFDKPRSMRYNARVWFASEYLEFINTRYSRSNPVSKKRQKKQKPEFDPNDILLLKKAARVRQDVADYAHTMLVKKKIGNLYRHLNFSVDQDAGVSQSFISLYRNEIREGKIRIADISMSKNLSNDQRRFLVYEGNKYLEEITMQMTLDGFIQGVGDQEDIRDEDTATEYLLNKVYKNRTKQEIIENLCGSSIYHPNVGFSYPFHFINEPNKRVIFRTDPTDMNFAQMAQFIVRAGTHPVDTYHARARVKVMGFERGLLGSGLIEFQSQ